ncbi:MAG TPA: N-acetyltransferase [Syntrophomonas sp.]|jgi:GNAT superfamily N-acetyltransferase|nr:N-acetyltransferase [Syntrophomonas sp.]HCF70107.1 N-acetyltransferase [Syntrophomonas sp.]
MIRKIKKEDKTAYLDMAKDFYSSEAVHQNVAGQHFSDTFNELMRSDDYAAGYIIEYQNHIAGYALLAKTYSQEAGGMVIWIEELYIMPSYRGLGLGHEFFAYLKSNLPNNIKRLRLEVEDSNKKAVSLYRRLGFENLPYSQMVK